MQQDLPTILLKRQRAVKSTLCGGQDPDSSNKKLLTCMGFEETDAQKFVDDPRKWAPIVVPKVKAFSARAIEATVAFVCMLKFNQGFFRFWGWRGLQALEELLDCTRAMEPSLPITLDYKAEDIDRSAWQYAVEAFKCYGVDAVTLGPYLGRDSVFQFRRLGFVFVLCRTSNPSAGEFQDLILQNGDPLYLHVAKTVSEWRKVKEFTQGKGEKAKTIQCPHDCGVVVGATYPEQMAKVAALDPSMACLIPAIGTQGGALKDTLQAVAGPKCSSRLFVLNASSSILFADDQAAAAMKQRDEINALLPEGFYS